MTVLPREVKVGKKVLVTTLLGPRQTPKGELGRLFWQRWNVELDLRNIKSTLGMECFSCKTPAMVEKEMWVYMLAYNLIRLLMAEAAPPSRSAAAAVELQAYAAGLGGPGAHGQFLSEAPEDTAGLFILIAHIRAGNRPGRIEPRMIKRRPNRYTFLGAPRWKARRRIKRRGHA